MLVSQLDITQAHHQLQYFTLVFVDLENMKAAQPSEART